MTDKINKTTVGDVAHSLVKGGLGTIPIIGSLATEIFGLIVTPPLEKRRAEWMNQIAEKLKALEDKNAIDFHELSNNEQFIDVVLQATALALKTSEKEKIKAFQNAVVNTASREAPDQTVSQIFLNQLDGFTTWHIRILKFIDNPRLWFQKANRIPPNYMAGSISAVIKDAFSELKNQDDLLDIIWNDLKTSGFHRTGDIKTTMTGDGTLSERTTQLGKQFLEFITNDRT
ncbi:hypothetical protein GA0116948_11092 [Chitinophaga costaii]|uniref:Uncharacterized protein n=1 Tax=Chitinophaga costaii TaxID=1335309 RepID=A0A1C4EXN1_9BACT|nr:hypothetical protein [Chitinophaga costaii]PUZ21572.1 hypothetical protein DCM91_16175 [Chitinophaga costaii]SCC48292.1 hypothetical protein GA0116948_11092 [Chitinophaga costaii]